MSLPVIAPEEAKRLLEQGAVLVDIREPDEHVREKIPGARLMPLSKLDEADLALHDGTPVIFHCRSGARTKGNAARLAGKASSACDAYIVEGGLEAWKKAGLPVVADRRQPLELQRQVQIGAGSLALFGTLLGLLLSPLFFIVPGFVGAGLMVAGITGFCGLARVLAKAPWNRAVYGRPDAARTA
ncbi:rhodanese-like domain-containing protein [Microvirga subterranea]|uniref:Rhodanese-related sulfurtransferase n=1 Tax=Microvirga subterranea TaxID=186651 RepID=A0A370HGJ2_9HYPH|nr:rhodanese-like domain-containing protein [Microvirga subterranea]RDI56753.1 rhodanese-related sulfurtransferase [Microvirga subterranea]